MRWLTLSCALTLALLVGPRAAPSAPGATRAEVASAEGENLDPGPTPVGAFTVRYLQPSLRLEVGYPFLDIGGAFGVVDRVLQVELGYRGLYGWTNTIYAGLKVTLVDGPTRTGALGLRVIGGYTDFSRDNSTYETQALVGGAGGFGELQILVTSRGRYHGFLFGVGVRISQFLVRPCPQNATCWEPVSLMHGKNGVVFTPFLELGLERKIGHRTSYFFVLGVDGFPGQDVLWFPAMVRFRNGVTVEF